MLYLIPSADCLLLLPSDSASLALKTLIEHSNDAPWVVSLRESVTSRPAEHLWLPLGGSGDPRGHLVERDLWDCPVLTGSAYG